MAEPTTALHKEPPLASRRKTAGALLTSTPALAQNTQVSGPTTAQAGRSAPVQPRLGSTPASSTEVQPIINTAPAPPVKRRTSAQLENEALRGVAHTRLDELLALAEGDRLFGVVGVDVIVQNGQFRVVKKKLEGTDKPREG